MPNRGPSHQRLAVMAGLVPAIHGSQPQKDQRIGHGERNPLRTFTFLRYRRLALRGSAWMAATSAAMTVEKLWTRAEDALPPRPTDDARRAGLLPSDRRRANCARPAIAPQEEQRPIAGPRGQRVSRPGLSACGGSTAKPAPLSRRRRGRRPGLLRQLLPMVAIAAQAADFLAKLVPVRGHLGKELAQACELRLQDRQLEGQLSAASVVARVAPARWSGMSPRRARGAAWAGAPALIFVAEGC